MPVLRLLVLTLVSASLAAGGPPSCKQIKAIDKAIEHWLALKDSNNPFYVVLFGFGVGDVLHPDPPPSVQASPPANFPCNDGAAKPPKTASTSLARRNVSSKGTVAAPLLDTTSSTFLYITDPGDDAIQVVDAATFATQATIQLPAGGTPQGIAITPDGAYAWVVEKGFAGPPVTASSLQIISTFSNQIVGSIQLPSLISPSWIAIAPDGRTAYVSNEGYDFLNNAAATDSILTIDIGSMTLTGQIPSPRVNIQIPSSGYAHFDRLAVSPDGTLLDVMTQFGVFVFDTLTNTQISPNPSDALALPNVFPPIAPIEGTQVVFHPNGTQAYYLSQCPHPNGGSACLAVFDITTAAVVNTVVLGPNYPYTTEPNALGITADGLTVLIYEFNSGDLIPVYTSNDKVGSHQPGTPATHVIFFNLAQ